MEDPFLACPETPFIHLEETDSTNAEAMRLAVAGDGGPLWVMADRQTAGRGRLGRQWISSDGNLHATLLITLHCEADEITQVSLLAGIALADAIAAAAAEGMPPGPDDFRPILKWPNDLLIANAKCAGVLLETTALSAGAFCGVLGFGVNIDAAPSIADRPATCLKQRGLHTTSAELLTHLDRAVRRAFRTLSAPDGFSHLKQCWLDNALRLGSPLTVTTDTEVCSGAFAGLDEDGALLLEGETGGLRRVTFGDVSAAGIVV